MGKQRAQHIQNKDVPSSCIHDGLRYRLSVVWDDEKSARAHAKRLRNQGWRATYRKIKPKKRATVYTLPVYATYTHQYPPKPT